jgi:hypothetical protein
MKGELETQRGKLLTSVAPKFSMTAILLPDNQRGNN